jgi:hypothetical protein
MARSITTQNIDYSPATVRAWANRPGSSYTIGARGRIPAWIVDAWDAAGRPVEPGSAQYKLIAKMVGTPQKATAIKEAAATVYVRHFDGATLRRALDPIYVSTEDLRAVRGPSRLGRPAIADYIVAGLMAGSIQENDLVQSIVTRNGKQHFAAEDGVQAFDWTAQYDLAEHKALSN